MRGAKQSKQQHNTSSPYGMRELFEDAGFLASDQHRIPRPLWSRIVFDFITVGANVVLQN
jgi:hypothetical protein